VLRHGVAQSHHSRPLHLHKSLVPWTRCLHSSQPLLPQAHSFPAASVWMLSKFCSKRWKPPMWIGSTQRSSLASKPRRLLKYSCKRCCASPPWSRISRWQRRWRCLLRWFLLCRRLLSRPRLLRRTNSSLSSYRSPWSSTSLLRSMRSSSPSPYHSPWCKSLTLNSPRMPPSMPPGNLSQHRHRRRHRRRRCHRRRHRHQYAETALSASMTRCRCWCASARAAMPAAVERARGGCTSHSVRCVAAQLRVAGVSARPRSRSSCGTGRSMGRPCPCESGQRERRCVARAPCHAPCKRMPCTFGR